MEKAIVEGLSKMLDEYNEIVKVFKTTRDCFTMSYQILIHVRLFGARNSWEKTYVSPFGFEIAGLIVKDIGESGRYRDVIVDRRNEGLKWISDIEYVDYLHVDAISFVIS